MVEPIPLWSGRLVSIGDREVFVRSAPTVGAVGAPALYVHGLGGSAANWTDLMALLGGHSGAVVPGEGATLAAGAFDAADATAGTTLLEAEAVDLPGFGFSPPPPDSDYSITGHARAVARLIERRGRGPVHLFGNSFGGAVCTRLAARRPDLVRTLTLISPALPDRRPRSATLSFPVFLVPGLGDRLMSQLRSRPVPARVAATVELIYFDPGRMHPLRRSEEIAELERRDALDYAGEVMLRSARAIVKEYLRVGRGSLWHDAAMVRAPVLAIFGSHDRLVDRRLAGRAARQFRVGRSVLLMQTGHAAMMEKPAAVAREVRAFIRDYAGRVGSAAHAGR
jgi:pimeloyl-ACP methyl ester carboxylesterase